MTEILSSSPEVERSARRRWLLLLGITLLLLGLAGAGASTLLEITLGLVFGPLLLASSIIQLLIAFLEEKEKYSLLHFAAAVPEMLLGFFVMMHPLLGVGSLAAWAAIALLASGLLRLVRSFATRPVGRSWKVMAGVVALLLALAVWAEWPVAAVWFVGLCLALDFICHGASWSAITLAEGRSLQQSAV